MAKALSPLFCGAGEAAQQAKALAAKSEDLSSIPGTHVVEKEKRFLKVVLKPSCAVAHRRIHTYTHTHTHSCQ